MWNTLRGSLIYLIISLSFSCTTRSEKIPSSVVENPIVKVDSFLEEKEDTVLQKDAFSPIDYDSVSWTEVNRLDSHFVLDLKYATTENFVAQQLYDCPRCFLRPAVAKALLEVQKELLTQGYTLWLFDCYRPAPIQQRLWEIMPNASYVTPPKKGSMHNRGQAVDLTIATLAGDTLEMGTPFDYFGPRGHHTYSQHSETVIKNRKLLKSTMEKHGFRSIRTEWWHYNYYGVKHALADMEWNCEH